jgi:hypothetical protein
VQYWLNRRTFPNAKNIYVGSHIRPHNFLHREFDDIKVKESTQESKNQLHADSFNNKNLKIISDDEYNLILNKYRVLSERMALE